MYYGRLACFGHVILLTLVMPLFSILFSISKYLQLIFTTKSDRKSLKQLVHRIQAEISVGQKSGRPVPTFLIAGAHFSKTLTIMRAIKAVLPGKKSRIILADSKKYALNGARFSRYCDVFEVVYSDPVTKSSEYADELVKIAERNQVTGFLPVSRPAGSPADALACEQISQSLTSALEHFNRPYHLSHQLCEILDNKLTFCQLCTDLGVTAPRTVLLDSEATARNLNDELLSHTDKSEELILKNLQYDCLHRLDLFTLPAEPKSLDLYLEKLNEDGNPIKPSEPWVAQTKLRGPEFSAACIIRDGKVQLLTISESSASQLRFEAVQNEKISEWVYEFVEKCNNPGPDMLLPKTDFCKNIPGKNIKKLLALKNCQLCFDFIEMGDKVYPVECNTRVHSQLSVFASTDIGQVILGAAILGIDLTANDLELFSTGKCHFTKRIMHFGDEVFKLIFGFTNYKPASADSDTFSIFLDHDADFSVWDPLPFFAKLHLQLPSLLIQNLIEGKPWKKLDFCIGKVVELHGE